MDSVGMMLDFLLLAVAFAGGVVLGAFIAAAAVIKAINK